MKLLLTIFLISGLAMSGWSVAAAVYGWGLFATKGEVVPIASIKDNPGAIGGAHYSGGK